MKVFYTTVGVLVAGVVAGSVMLIPNSSELEYMATNNNKKEESPEKITGMKQEELEAKIAKEGLVAQTVSDLADSYVAQGKTDKGIEVMERYHAKYPTDIQMLDKLGVIYHVAGMDDKYIGILEEENELMPSVNTSYILQARYSALYGDTKPEKTIVVLRKLIKLQPENIQNYRNLIFFLFKANKGDEVIRTINDFKTRFPGQMDYSFTFSLVDQLIKQGNVNEAYNEAEKWIQVTPNPALIDFSTMFYNAKRPDLAMKLLAGKDEEIKKNPLLVLLHVKAALATDPKLALQLTTDWMKAHPTDNKMLEDFGNIFFAAKHYQEAITLYTPYRATVVAHKTMMDIYRESLVASIKTHPENVPLLAALYEDELKNPATTIERKKALLFALLDMGATNVALPYAEGYAFQYRGDWVYMYEGMLKKLHDHAKLAAFRAKYVHTVNLTYKEAHYFASIYLDEGNKPEAERLLWLMAAGKPAKNQEVQGLLYLWGNNPGVKQVAWLEKRAGEATDQDKLDWLKILMNLRDYDGVIKVVSDVPRDDRSIQLVTVYFDALRLAKKKEILKTELSAAFEQEQNENRLAYYSKTAREQGLFEMAGKGYEKLMVIDPNNLEYLKERGMVAYYTGDVETAKTCLNQYYEEGGKDTMAIFFFAELLQQSNTLQAKPLFEATIRLMEEAPSLTLEERVVKIHSLARLHRIEQANKEMNELLAENPENKYLQLDYVEFLIDTREYKKAIHRLGESAKPEPQALMSQLWRINRKNLVAIEHTRVPNELVLVFDRPLGKIPKAQIRQMQDFHPEWVTGVYPGYDTVLVVATTDKELGYTAEGVNLIVEAKHSDAAGQSADTSLRIRKELLYARIEQETHKNSEAIDRLTQLLQKYPDDVGVITGLAIADRAYGRRLRALDLAEQAHTLEPENRWVNILLADMKKEEKHYVRADFDWMHITGNDQFITSLKGIEPVNRNVKMGATVENNFYRFKNLQLSNGDIGKGSGSSQRGQIDAMYEFESGPIAKTSLYLNPGASLGIGEQVTTYDFMGMITGYVEYQRSDWTFTERIKDNVKRNRIGVLQSYSPVPEVYSYFGGSTTQYDQDNKDDATESFSLTGGIHAPVSVFDAAWQDLPVVVGYGLDAEYVTSREYGINSSGDAYRLYPLVSREVHVIDGTYRESFDPTFVGEFTAGLAYDRISGDSGPSIAARLTKSWDDGCEAQLRASHGISFTQSGSGVTNMGGYFLCRF